MVGLFFEPLSWSHLPHPSSLWENWKILFDFDLMTCNCMVTSKRTCTYKPSQATKQRGIYFSVSQSAFLITLVLLSSTLYFQCIQVCLCLHMLTCTHCACTCTHIVHIHSHMCTHCAHTLALTFTHPRVYIYTHQDTSKLNNYKRLGDVVVDESLNAEYMYTYHISTYDLI